MEKSNSIPSRALHLLLTTCLILTSHAFQTINPHHTTINPTTTSLQARKGNRGGKSSVGENTSKRDRSVNDLLDGIAEAPEFPHSVDPLDLPDGPIEADPLAPLIRSIVHAADMRKAIDIVAMRVTQCTSLTNFVVIVSGTSRPQNQAIASAIAKDVEDEYDGKRCLGKGVPEGSADSGWILLDYGEVMVHVMTPKSRLFYDMDGQWRERGGQEMDVSDVLVDEITGLSNGALEEGGESELSMKERLDVEKEDDPFWS
mmetsp:Transcript_20615/g.44782  ORF Transcript_20615/g.44782 Transcript_20615/m.44782 type:complete len:258 (+) Transcript_20615:165-938(+)|eukprot:CAMPEP_0172299814 /NCGR_PEP_ID=MMETSP1058-20130122/2022_1 /TAXON_ID=83371 /ORGANISM="Detonula confervacea, Strain CCMP 353" /LENGTH=257 /DNA_ID=CAMNT_0013009381 /DNA_START=161 /DNA_END=934 /DNA_ORIENTATION=-